MANYETSRAAVLALKYVNNTNKCVFLTGKAGSGKTTFLKRIVEITHKSTVIAAPTGIAAINAGGVTLHSLFQLPFGMFIPDSIIPDDFPNHLQIHTPKTLISTIRLSKPKMQLLRKMELLIIDEVSMLRSDLLDAINTILCYVRRNNMPFGGVQILFIGDLQQLPPVVKDIERGLLRRFYKDEFIFSAQVFQSNNLIYVELEKIFRQSDADFISVLNNIRDNCLTTKDKQLLATRCKTESEIENDKGYVYLTTHNMKADGINSRKLSKLNSQEYTYQAEISDDFPERIYPIEPSMTLKVGAQVMFLKNDVSGEQLFYNGKIGFVESLDEEEVIVGFEDDTPSIYVEKYTWENVRFKLNKKTDSIEENVKGRFVHFPLKLAWAITIHKSQGLTFEKAIIDVTSAFAPGQIYVALSRMTALSGLILLSNINQNLLFENRALLDFAKTKKPIDSLFDEYDDSVFDYVKQFATVAFSFETIENTHKYKISPFTVVSSKAGTPSEKSLLDEIRTHFTELLSIANNFIRQLSSISAQKKDNKKTFLTDRIEKAANYFLPLIKKHRTDIQEVIRKQRGKKNVKQFTTELKEINELYITQIEHIKKSELLAKSLVSGNDIAKDDVVKNANMKKTAHRNDKRKSHEISFEMFQEGNSIQEIAENRAYTEATILKHLTVHIESGQIKPEKFIVKEKKDLIYKAVNEISSLRLTPIFEHLEKKVPYEELRVAVSAFKFDFPDSEFIES